MGIMKALKYSPNAMLKSNHPECLSGDLVNDNEDEFRVRDNDNLVLLRSDA
jgi:hypothetical protein